MEGPSQHNRDATTTNLGRLLIECGACSAQELDEALRHQQRFPEQKLGEILVAKGRVPSSVIDLILAQQAAMRRGTVRATVELYEALGRCSRAVERTVSVLGERMHHQTS
jgi:hypothetical protein